MPPLSEFSHCFCPNFLIAFARISHCFCPNFLLLLPEFAIAFSQNSGKSNGKILGKTNGNILAKAMRKLGKRLDIFLAKLMEVLGTVTNLNIIFKIYFLDQIEIIKDLASSARISQYT